MCRKVKFSSFLCPQALGKVCQGLALILHSIIPHCNCRSCLTQQPNSVVTARRFDSPGQEDGASRNPLQRIRTICEALQSQRWHPNPTTWPSLGMGFRLRYSTYHSYKPSQRASNFVRLYNEVPNLAMTAQRIIPISSIVRPPRNFSKTLTSTSS